MPLKPFRTVPADAKEWSRWMSEQDLPAEEDLSITESQVSDLGSYVTTATVMTGAGTPEGVVTAQIGTLFLRTDGGTSTTLYVKETGVGNTGWVAK